MWMLFEILLLYFFIFLLKNNETTIIKYPGICETVVKGKWKSV